MVCGLQWGDEAKGKITHILSESADVVCRFAGGPNSGHTIVTGDNKVVMHVVPAGILKSNTVNIMGSGMVIDPVGLIEELEGIIKFTDYTGRLFISEGAHLILEYHRYLEKLDEKARGKSSIGTSMRGIGPCYADKIDRIGIRVGVLRDEKLLRHVISKNLKRKNRIFTDVYGEKPLTEDEVLAPILEASKVIIPMLADTSQMAFDAVESKKNLLLEGNQGILLDLDHGTYPYVTSSSCLPTSGMAALGLSPRYLDRIIGITKSYQTRVGKGPFPTKQDNEIGEKIRQRGNEYGSTTGRPRDCGWLDLVALKYAVRVSGATELTMTLLDVLDDFDQVKVCTAYDAEDGTTTDRFSPESFLLERVKPVYKTIPGWKEDTSKIKKFSELPENAKKYINIIEEITGVPVTMISVGPDEDQTIRRNS